ncbi:hypothetical protein [Micromonospora sp. NPDC050276]|uniref:hypothetical protein n=1 Tax=Micromonospora sp. NPDC050276 TaxID=3364278 RepID=UPI00378C33DF
MVLDEATVKLISELWRKQRRRFGEVDPMGQIFVHANGRPVSPDWLTRLFAKLVKWLGLTAAGTSERSDDPLGRHEPMCCLCDLVITLSDYARDCRPATAILRRPRLRLTPCQARHVG